MQKTLLEKLNKYDGKVIGLYCDFWGIEKIEFSFSAPEAKRFTERNKSAVNKGYTLVVTDVWRERDRNRVYISLSQLIYDLDVFYAIPAEIHNVIQKERFADFAGLSLRRMEQNGWEIGFTNSGYYTDTILSKYPVSFVSEDYRPESKRIFIINCWDEEFTKSYFDALKYDYYIETHRALALLR